MSRVKPYGSLLAVIATLGIVALIGSSTSVSTQQDFITALVSAVIVYGLYIFVGNSGVLSFGHISFVALGAFLAGEMTIPTSQKHLVLPGLWSVLANNSMSSFESLVLAAILGGIYALVIGLPLMRLSGIAAGIATLAVLEITNNLFSYWDKIGPGVTTLSLVPVSTGILEAFIGAVVAAVVAFAYQRSRRGRLLRATREDPAAAQAIGVNITRERLIAFTISGMVAGLGGGLLVHQLGSIVTSQVYLELTFLTLAMLVIGGSGSLWGATVGAIGVSLIYSFLSTAENGEHVIFFKLTLPTGATDLILGVIMAAMLLFKPRGVTGGAEFALRVPGVLRRRGERGGGSEPPGQSSGPPPQPAGVEAGSSD